jgi:hypothetical protein
MALEFRAPWSRSLKTASAVVVGALAAMAAAAILIVPARLALVRSLLVLLPVSAVAMGLIGMVSGYTLTATHLQVRRPLWSTAFPLTQLLGVAGDAQLFKGSLRLFGNGGMFSFTGLFWKRGLGCYRAYATDPARAVILKFPSRTIVVTPDDPQRFIVRLRTHLANAREALRA